MVCSTDPLSFIPPLGPRYSAWLSANLIASDIATSGFPPQYGIFDFNLPPTMPNSVFATYWRAFHQECRRLGVSIIAGHTGRYVGCDYTIIGGGTMMTICPLNQFLTSNMARAGDDLILTKGAAIETTAVLTRSFPHIVKRRLGQRLFDKALGYATKVSSVEDALTAASAGLRGAGVTAMHDATEGGVIGGIFDLVNASRLGATVDLESIFISEETREVCKLFHLDPLISLSEGSLLISTRPSKTGKVLRLLSVKGVRAKAVGRLLPGFRGVHATTRRGTIRVHQPSSDPYWAAYWRAKRRSWS